MSLLFKRIDLLRFAVGLSATILGSFLVVQSWSSEPSASQRVYEKEYVNPVYGYRINIPAGLTAVGNSAPNPNHGVKIQFPGGGRASIFIEAHYVDENTLAEASKTILSFAKGRCDRIENFSQSETSLGGLQAARLEYDCFKAEPTFMVTIVAHRTAPGYSPILYEIGLETHQKGQLRENAVAVLEEIRSHFEVLPLK